MKRTRMFRYVGLLVVMIGILGGSRVSKAQTAMGRAARTGYGNYAYAAPSRDPVQQSRDRTEILHNDLDVQQHRVDVNREDMRQRMEPGYIVSQQLADSENRLSDLQGRRVGYIREQEQLRSQLKNEQLDRERRQLEQVRESAGFLRDLPFLDRVADHIIYGDERKARNAERAGIEDRLATVQRNIDVVDNAMAAEQVNNTRLRQNLTNTQVDVAIQNMNRSARQP